MAAKLTAKKLIDKIAVAGSAERKALSGLFLAGTDGTMPTLDSDKDREKIRVMIQVFGPASRAGVALRELTGVSV